MYKGIAREYNFVHYLLFVTYFPHLIAGPVLHHKQMMPQFQRASTYKLNFENINIGIMIFSIGLFKKVLFADQFALFATPFFNSVTEASQPNLTDAWMGAILYTLQLYFDFSGYSDMAIGISKMFNVDLPFNFNSPYKANNIIDFWRRWHITLSSFLRDYLYIPLGGNRKGVFRRYINLIVTMLLGGMWHGASCNFILWGALHGIYLAINHLWISLTGKLAINTQISDILGKIITFLAVVVAWVIFRAKDIGSGLRILEGMFGFNDNTLPSFFEIAKNIIAYLFPHYHLVFTKVPPGQTMGLFLGLVIVFLLPNSQELVGLYSETNKNLLKKYFILNQSFVSAFYIGFLFFISVLMIMSGSESEFLYFQF